MAQLGPLSAGGEAPAGGPAACGFSDCGRYKLAGWSMSAEAETERRRHMYPLGTCRQMDARHAMMRIFPLPSITEAKEDEKGP